LDEIKVHQREARALLTKSEQKAKGVTKPAKTPTKP
jgi:hypothetical protein